MEGREAESCKGRSTSFQAHGRVRVQQGQHSWFWCTQVHSYTRPHLWPQGGVGWDRLCRGGVEWVLLEVHAQRIMGHSFKDRACYIICRAQSIKKKGKNVGTLVQTSKKVKDTKAKSINARLSCWEPPGCAQSVTRSRDERGACKAVLPLGVVLGARYVPFLFLSYCWVFD